MKRLRYFLAVLLMILPLASQASWWNNDWKFRKKITLNTSPTGADIKEAAGSVPVAVRLHSGNFLFSDAKPDGSDLRFVASDDKTPLKYFVEFFDATNQLALVWVELPKLSPASSADYFFLYSGNEKAPAGGDQKSAYDPQQLLGLEFAEAQGGFKDGSAYASAVTSDGVVTDPAGLFGPAALFSGKPLTVAGGPSLRVAPGGTLTLSLWVKPNSSQGASLLTWGDFQVTVEGDHVSAQLGGAHVSGGKLVPGAWNHVGVSASTTLDLWQGGALVGSAPVQVPDINGNIVIGQGFQGSLDNIALFGALRPGPWMQALASQGTEGKLLAYGDPEAGEDAGGTSYIKILFSSLTLDAKVVIGILGFMFLVAVSVMVNRAMVLKAAAAGNRLFIDAFESRISEFLDPDSSVASGFGDDTLPKSTLARLYQTGIREIRNRKAAGRDHLSAESMAAIKASIDSTLIRQSQHLNKLMVFLTIAISGGPFLGLLGTVVGVMITFASIAAAGDVNINAIAPGIAAALLATVAGLGVAIPSLFGYNWLITQIKAISADMQAFSDEFVCKLAEVHSGAGR